MFPYSPKCQCSCSKVIGDHGGLTCCLISLFLMLSTFRFFPGRLSSSRSTSVETAVGADEEVHRERSPIKTETADDDADKHSDGTRRRRKSKSFIAQLEHFPVLEIIHVFYFLSEFDVCVSTDHSEHSVSSRMMDYRSRPVKIHFPFRNEQCRGIRAAGRQEEQEGRIAAPQE